MKSSKREREKTMEGKEGLQTVVFCFFLMKLFFSDQMNDD